ncbi:MAG: serine hydrolase domain-containing protein, partial [Melioribacteraceae bacterium]|nr:serine hydrolase domain-containing protein [Melioribacteraceae bacterium]
ILLFSCSFGENINLEKQIDEIFTEFQIGTRPGASVAVIKDSRIIYKKGFGVANLESGQPINSETNFRLASITKQFTALSVLLLENEGKLSLFDKITDYFPELNHYAHEIKIINILQHTSGFLDYEHFVDAKDTIQLKDSDVLEILSGQDSTYFEPGTKHKYSNSGYAVLALLVDRVSGLSFAEFLDKKIFQPLKMNNTVAFEKGISTVSQRAIGYTDIDEGFINSDQSLTSAVLGDGGIYSSITDLLKWNKEVEEPTLLPEEKFFKVFEKGKTNSLEEFDYGLGWRLDPYKGLKRHYHTGGTSGFTNIYMKMPELNLTVIILINLWEYNAKGFAERVSDIFINEKPIKKSNQ